MSNPLLSVCDYTQHFRINRHLTVRAVDGVSFDVQEGEIFGIVGESGSGKSTLARGIMGLYTPTSGQIVLDGCLVSEKRAYNTHKQHIQRTMQGIFQDSAAALNPRMTVAECLAEPLEVSGLCPDKDQRVAEVARLLELVGLDALYSGKVPAEISGGQRQRVAIARSLAVEPRLLVADEPVAALDVSIQAQIVTLLQQLQRKRNLAMLFIAHDLGMVRWLCDRVAVMYGGKLVEMAPKEALFCKPLHPYTQSLLSAAPVPDPRYERNKVLVPYVHDAERAGAPWREVYPGHFVRG